MKRWLRVLIGALLGLVLTLGLLAGAGTPAVADNTATGSISGTVTRSTGAAAVGVVAILYTIDDNGVRTEVAEVATVSGGRFWLGSFPVGRYYLLVTDQTLDDAATWWPTPAGPYRPDPFDLTAAGVNATIAMNPGYDISGTVRFQGKPVSGVRVCVAIDTECSTSSASGAYAIHGVAGGMHQVVAEPPRNDLPYVRTYFPNFTEAWSEVAGLQMVDADSTSQPWDFDLAEVPYVGGTVVNTAGSPISGASVCMGNNCMTTGADGAFRFYADLPSHYFPTLIVKAKGFVDGYQEIGAGQHEAKVTLETPSPVRPATVSPGDPKIKGKTKVGARLTAVPGTWGPAGVQLSYRWYRNGKKISGATKAFYRLSRQDARKKITVKVTGRLAGSTAVTKASKATKKISWR